MTEEGLEKVEEQVQNNELKDLIEEDLTLTRENNKLLKRMHRNAMLGLGAKIVIWFILLGVPLFFLSPYLGPIFSLLTTGTAPQGASEKVLGVPSTEQLQQLLEAYSGK